MEIKEYIGFLDSKNKKKEADVPKEPASTKRKVVKTTVAKKKGK